MGKFRDLINYDNSCESTPSPLRPLVHLWFNGFQVRQAGVRNDSYSGVVGVITAGCCT